MKRITPRFRPAAFCTPDSNRIGGNDSTFLTMDAGAGVRETPSSVSPPSVNLPSSVAWSGPSPPGGPQEDPFAFAQMANMQEHNLDAILSLRSPAESQAQVCMPEEPGKRAA
jgi:hypothetical protein